MILAVISVILVSAPWMVQSFGWVGPNLCTEGTCVPERRSSSCLRSMPGRCSDGYICCIEDGPERLPLCSGTCHPWNFLPCQQLLGTCPQGEVCCETSPPPPPTTPTPPPPTPLPPTECSGPRLCVQQTYSYFFEGCDKSLACPSGQICCNGLIDIHEQCSGRCQSSSSGCIREFGVCPFGQFCCTSSYHHQY